MKWWEIEKGNSIPCFWLFLEVHKAGLVGLGTEIWTPAMQPWPCSFTVFPICENKDDNAVCILTWSPISAQWTLAFIHLYESIHWLPPPAVYLLALPLVSAQWALALIHPYGFHVFTTSLQRWDFRWLFTCWIDSPHPEQWPAAEIVCFADEDIKLNSNLFLWPDQIEDVFENSRNLLLSKRDQAEMDLIKRYRGSLELLWEWGQDSEQPLLR